MARQARAVPDVGPVPVPAPPAVAVQRKAHVDRAGQTSRVPPCPASPGGTVPVLGWRDGAGQKGCFPLPLGAERACTLERPLRLPAVLVEQTYVHWP